MLTELITGHPGPAFAYYLNIPFEETLLRHASKPQAAEYGEAEMRNWYRERDLLPGGIEHVIPASHSGGHRLQDPRGHQPRFHRPGLTPAASRNAIVPAVPITMEPTALGVSSTERAPRQSGPARVALSQNFLQVLRARLRRPFVGEGFHLAQDQFGRPTAATLEHLLAASQLGHRSDRRPVDLVAEGTPKADYERLMSDKKHGAGGRRSIAPMSSHENSSGNEKHFCLSARRCRLADN
jgi:hypothetical protein